MTNSNEIMKAEAVKMAAAMKASNYAHHNTVNIAREQGWTVEANYTTFGRFLDYSFTKFGVTMNTVEFGKFIRTAR